SFEYTGGAEFGIKFLDKNLKIFSQNLPIGYKFKKLTTIYQTTEEDNTIYLIFPALLVGFIIFIIIFESFYFPFILVCLLLPPYLGVFLTLYCLNLGFNQGVVAALILLGVNVISIGVFIVHSYLHLSIDTHTKTTGSVFFKVLKDKSKAIALSIFSTCISAVPLIAISLKNSFWFTFGYCMVGGCLFTLIAFFIYLPILILNKKSAKQL
ncbi:MAG TPA: hypothetical protein DCM08_04885, partial [Microscillaceae bacterium]|nr:hypothetical protein [Microscillaceae bacterium]